MNDPKSNCPFTGQPCPYHKSLHITDIVEGHCAEIHFCGKCSDKAIASLEVIQPITKKVPVVAETPPEMIPVNKPPLSQTNLFFEFLNFMLDPKSRNRPQNRPPKACPGCGLTMDDIRRIQRLGCPKCHDVFHQELYATLLKAHSGGMQHVGKSPKNLEAQKNLGSLQNQLERLEDKLREAVSKEEYESAATIRDAINEVKKQLAGG